MQFDMGDAPSIVRNVTYFFAADGAKVFDGHHCYGSDNWLPLNCAPPGPGERWDSERPWSNGKKPCFLDGKGGVCGPLDWWQNGVPSDAPPVDYSIYGIPVCCPKPLAMPWFDNGGDFSGRSMTFTGEPGGGWSLSDDDFGIYAYADGTGDDFIIAEQDLTCANATVPEGFTTVRWFKFSTQVDVFLVLQSYDEATFTGVFKSPVPPMGAPPALRVVLRIPRLP